MNVTVSLILLAGGLVVLWKSADVLVEGAVSLAKLLGVSALVIGLTVVAMGTSAPEVAASIAAVVRAAPDIAIGNVYGSNIANLALVGGICAIIAPILIKKKMLRREIPVMLGVALLLWPALFDKMLSRGEGIFLLTIFAGLIFMTVYFARKQGNSGKVNGAEELEKISRQMSIQKSLLFIVIGLIGLAFGAEMTVRGAVFIGERIGLSRAVIGLTIIAIGTSLPELMTCVMATVKGQNDLSIGNLIGSNIFNTLLVTGIAGFVRPLTVVSRLAGGVDYWIMMGVSTAFVVIILLGRGKIGRTGGAVLLCGYVIYMVYLLKPAVS